MKLCLSVCVASAFSICTGVWQLQSQISSNIFATVQFSNGHNLTVTDFSEPIGVAANSTTHVTVALPGSAAGERVNVAPLDGGRVLSHDAVVSGKGTIALAFRASGSIGLHRVEVRHGTHKLRLQFWVLDTTNPENNPSVITPRLSQD
ncbi:MAG TPA: hypothetical protein VJ721_00160 [Chthoniobacterales bacterium]|nr:hypothetical protein [Chthoniobacterales bacterium]